MPGESPALLRRLIAQRGLTQAAFAAQAGLSKDHVSRMLRGAVPFPTGRRTLARIARALDCRPDVFPEYREEAGRAGPSARRLLERLEDDGLDEGDFFERIPQYSAGYLRAILGGRCAFPTDPAAIEAIARACGASPFDFREYLPDAGSRDRWLAAAERALDAQDFGVFRYLMDKVSRFAERT